MLALMLMAAIAAGLGFVTGALLMRTALHEQVRLANQTVELYREYMTDDSIEAWEFAEAMAFTIHHSNVIEVRRG
jgi:hypothetical protein